MKKKALLAIDFDETIVYNEKFPKIKGLRKGAKKYINKLYDQGYHITIWTCRTDKDLCKDASNAKQFLQDNGVKFDLFNQNYQPLINAFGTDSKKVSCDLYIDDKGLWPFGIPSWFTLYWLIKFRLFWDKKRALDYCKYIHFNPLYDLTTEGAKIKGDKLEYPIIPNVVHTMTGELKKK